MAKVDGVRVYDGGYVYFDDWLKEEGYYKQETMRDIYLSNGMDEEEFDNMMDNLLEQFEQWAEENDLEPQEI